MLVGLVSSHFTELTTPCCLHMVADTDVSPFAYARSISCGHKFRVRDTKNVSDSVQKHFATFYQGPPTRGHIVADTLLPIEVSWAAQTGKHLLRTQNNSEQDQKQFLCPGHNVARAGKRGNICVGNNNRFTRALHTRGSRSRRFAPSEHIRKRLFCSLGKHLCRQQCVGNNVSSFATTSFLGPWERVCVCQEGL